MLFNNAVPNTETIGTEPKITMYCRLGRLMKIFVVYFKTRLSMPVDANTRILVCRFMYEIQ